MQQHSNEQQVAEATKGPWWLTLRVIDEPVTVFRQLAIRPRFWAPLVLIALVSLVAGFGAPDATLEMRAAQQAEVLQDRAPDRFTEAQRDEMIARAASSTNRLMITGGFLVYGVLSLLLVAAVLLVVFNGFGREPLSYKDELAIATHAYVPQLLGVVILVLLARFAGYEDMQLSLGFLFDEGFLRHLGTQFTPFGAWNVVLLALGNTIRADTKSIWGPLAIVGGLWVLVNIGFAAISAAMGGLAG
jgi:hypothetical protein